MFGASNQGTGNMKKLLLAGVCSLAIAASASSVKAADMDPLEYYDWSGSYFGIKLGYGDTDSLITNHNAGTTQHFGLDGFIGGIMSGYNFQMDNLVFGLDSDTSFTTIKNTVTTAACVTTCRNEIDFLSTTRFRVGYAMDRILPYMTAGLASALVDSSASGLSGKRELHFGWTVGAGLEWAFMDGWHARIEGLYVDFGRKSHNFGGNAGRVEIDDMFLVRAGVSMDIDPIINSIFGN